MKFKFVGKRCREGGSIYEATAKRPSRGRSSLAALCRQSIHLVIRESRDSKLERDQNKSYWIWFCFGDLGKPTNILDMVSRIQISIGRTGVIWIRKFTSK